MNIDQVPTQSQGLWKACGVSLTWWERWPSPREGGAWVWAPRRKASCRVWSSEPPSYWQGHLVVSALDLTGPSAYSIPPWLSTLSIFVLHFGVWWELRPFSPHRVLTWTVNLYIFFLGSRVPMNEKWGHMASCDGCPAHHPPHHRAHLSRDRPAGSWSRCPGFLPEGSDLQRRCLFVWARVFIVLAPTRDSPWPQLPHHPNTEAPPEPDTVSHTRCIPKSSWSSLLAASTKSKLTRV